MLLIRRLTELSREWKPEVEILKDVVCRAWDNCKVEYIQLRVATITPMDSDSHLDRITEIIDDLESFKNLHLDLTDKFRSRHVWRAWHYIRPLVVKYVPDWGNDGQIKHLDKGKQKLEAIVVFWMYGVLEGFPTVKAEQRKPKVVVTEFQWCQLPQDPLYRTVTDAAQFCGYKKKSPEPWHYSVIFNTDSTRFLGEVIS
jgi:hypothetical protein